MSEYRKGKRPCKYRSSTPHINGCDYLYLMSKRRGCPAGEQCTRFEEGARIKDPSDPTKITRPSLARDLDVICYTRDRIIRALEYRQRNHM